MDIGGYFIQLISPPSIEPEIKNIFNAAEQEFYKTDGSKVQTAVSAALKTAEEKGINAPGWRAQVEAAAKSHWGASDFGRYMKKNTIMGQKVMAVVEFIQSKGSSLKVLLLLPALAIGALAWGVSRVNNEQA